MRKVLVYALLLCMILTSLSTGTLAVYTTRTEVHTGTISAKRFHIGASSVNNLDIRLAPGESSYNEFTVTNIDDKGMATEVDMSLTIAGDFRDLYEKIPGIRVTLTEVGNEGVHRAADADGSLSYYDRIGFAANKGNTRTFRLVFSWESNEDDQALYAGQHVSAISLYITGTQAV